MATTTDILQNSGFLDHPMAVLSFLEETMDEDAGTYSDDAAARIEEVRDRLSDQRHEADNVSAFVWEMQAGHFEDEASAADDDIDALIDAWPSLTGLTINREIVTIPHPTYAPGLPGMRYTAR